MSTITEDKDLAIQRLRDNDIVAIPTETVYGLAGNASNETAIRKIFALKKRPLDHPLILHVAKDANLSEWAIVIPDYAKTLMHAFWPGPLTLVLSCKPGSINPLVNGGQTTIAIRCPSHPMAQSLLTALEFPLVAPSANPFGKISPVTAAHVQHSFPDSSLLILDGGRCQVGIESTIVAATHPEGYEVLRHGMVDEQAISTLLPGQRRSGTDDIRVPGKLEHHYQPEKPLYCFRTTQELAEFCATNASVYVLSFSKNSEFSELPGYQLPKNPEKFAYELYFQLRCADLSSAVIIATELPPEDDAWEGIRERILKAASVAPRG